MASSLTRSSLECSSSGRGVVSAYPPVRLQRSRTVARPQGPAPDVCLLPASQWQNGNSLPQPPRWSKATRRQLQPQRVAQEVNEITPSENHILVDLDELNEAWGIPGVVEFGIGQGDLPNVLLTHPQTGMQLVVYLFGATIAQWLKDDGTATFYDGPDELYYTGLPLRTGVSLHFPQHRDGMLPHHGFADAMVWEVVGAGIDNPEIAENVDRYWETLQEEGVVTQQMLQEASQSEEGASALRAALKDQPTPELLLEGDLAPFITLRLRDTDETRSIWPHSFELLYKITLGVQDYLTEEDVKEIAVLEGLVPDDLAVGDGGDDEEDGGEEELQGEEQQAEGEAAETSGQEGEAEEEQPVAAPAAKRRGRPRKQEAAAAGAFDDGDDGASADDDAEDAAAPGADEEAAAAEDDDEDEDDEEEYDNDPTLEEGAIRIEPQTYVPPVQVKQQFWLRNKDKQGSPPMQFNLGSLARFATLQQPQYGDWVKVLGLGGSQVFDYTKDLRYPSLDLNEEDFLHFRGQQVDVTYVDAADATVYLCPGNRTHFEFIQREGFRDMFVEQPGLESNPDYARVAAVGTGYVASTKKLAPGREWYAESVIRFHNRYWREPVFGDDTMPPLPPISPKEMMSEGVNGEGEEGDAYDGLPSEPTGLAPDRDD